MSALANTVNLCFSCCLCKTVFLVAKVNIDSNMSVLVVRVDDSHLGVYNCKHCPGFIALPNPFLAAIYNAMADLEEKCSQMYKLARNAFSTGSSTRTEGWQPSSYCLELSQIWNDLLSARSYCNAEGHTYKVSGVDILSPQILRCILSVHDSAWLIPCRFVGLPSFLP